MKKTFSLFIVLALTSSLIFFSCSKKGDPGPSKDQLLATAKGWKLTDATLTVSGVTQPVFSSIPACIIDDITYFKSDYSYLEDEGATKCASTDPQTVESGTWKFNSAKTVITVVSSSTTNPGTVTLNVVTLTATTLVVKENVDVSGVSAVGNYTFTAIQ